MPTSIIDGRGWVVDRIRETTSPIIVDAGCGEGTYSTLARHYRDDARWIGVEVHEPYVDRFLLGQKYDDIVVADLRVWRPILSGYSILFGDVLEHMTRDEAVDVLLFHVKHADEIMVSVPIVYSPQSGCFGNEHEAHQHHWTFDEMSALLPGAESFEGATVSRWWWTR